jgi:hypothetical protein
MGADALEMWVGDQLHDLLGTSLVYSAKLEYRSACMHSVLVSGSYLITVSLPIRV